MVLRPRNTTPRVLPVRLFLASKSWVQYCNFSEKKEVPRARIARGPPGRISVSIFKKEKRNERNASTLCQLRELQIFPILRCWWPFLGKDKNYPHSK